MRSGIFFLALILVGCKSDLPSSIAGIFRSRCDLKAYYQLEQKHIHVIDSEELTTESGQILRLDYLRKGNMFFAAIGKDTFRQPGWNYYSLKVTDEESREHPLAEPIRIYEEHELAEIIVQPCLQDKPKFILLNSTAEEGKFISLASITSVQLDHDPALERVVFCQKSVIYQYHFWDEQNGSWIYHGKTELYARTDPEPIDQSLPGFFGLQSAMWGTGLNALCYDYFQLTPDSFTFCFSIDTHYGQFMWWTAGKDYNASMHSGGKGRLINDSTVEVRYNTSFELTDTAEQDETTIVFRHDQFVKFRFHKSQPDSAWIPDPGHTGFYESRNFFYPEIEMMFELYRLKESGTKKQKYFLRGLEIEPDPFFR